MNNKAPNVIDLKTGAEYQSAANNSIQHLQFGGGGGITGGMEARVAKLESDVSYIKENIGDIKSDIRGMRSDARQDLQAMFKELIWVAVGLGSLMLALLGVMAKGFGWI